MYEQSIVSRVAVPVESESVYPSLTASAVQVRWKTPTEFPECPETVSETALEDYATQLSYGTLFAENEYNSSWVVDTELTDNSLIVLTHFGEDALKCWAVSHVSVQSGMFHHRSEHTFRTLRGALKHFCSLAGIDMEDSVDDYE